MHPRFPWRRRLRAVSLTEIVIALLILALAVIPIIGLLTGGRERAHMSESQIYAELICTRIVEDYATRNYGGARRVGASPADWIKEFREEIDGKQAVQGGKSWLELIPEFAKNISWEGPAPIEAKTEVKRGPDDGAGLISFEVQATWGDRHGAVKFKESTYNLIRMRAKRDYVMRRVEGVKLDDDVDL